MDTLHEEPATTETDEDTQSIDESEETDDVDTSKDDKQKDAAVKKQLADKDRYIKELEAKKPSTSNEIQELEWKLENKERIALVKDEYEAIVEKGYEGEKVSKRIALELAEKQANIDTTDIKRSRQDDITTPSVTNRNIGEQGYESEEDKVLGLTREKKRKLEERHPHLKG